MDKTECIRKLLNKQYKARRIVRPRRFGKTLTMNMLEDFYVISRGSRIYFEGLRISKENSYAAIYKTIIDMDRRVENE